MSKVIFNDIDFKKSTLSPQKRNPQCVAVAQKDGMVAVRDTKDANKTTLLFTRDEWEAFVAGVKNNEFDVQG